MSATRHTSSAIPDPSTPLEHPFYKEAGINCPPGPDRHPLYSELARARAAVVPIVRSIRGEAVRAYLICRYKDVQAVMRRQEVFSRAAAAPADDVDVAGTILGMDGAEHARVRGVVKDAFTPQAVADLTLMVEETAATRLADMAAKGPPADLVEDFALRFTLDTICDLLGLPGEDRLRFRAWGDSFLGTADPEQAAQSQREMGAYLAGILEARRVGPAEDLLTRIAGAELPLESKIMLAIALVVGGWETTASSIGRYVVVLRTRPYRDHDTGWAHLLDHPGDVDGAVTELERLFSTSAGDDMPRRTMEDVELPSGARLSAGDIVIPSHDAANRDPDVFPDPERMDFRRPESPHHLSFGYGAHYCVGAHLGALIVRVAIARLLRELPGLRLAVPAGQVRWKRGHSLTTPENLPVTW